ncbi:uncharacterized protein CLUP02_15743 [Colletotrichum lupini]|uniref:Uncharacterized protein n=1 Tax=Colletotrichum lupini TaxID=145971 RepID=A0A9Q8T7A7_9PEZI|nr:uncharacterized protein CLUP02_15743 [Colletotrichum lupini]UQC90213.1 hypothetical protein CLUP02_15743 [Colletotrichum lupini]
MSRVLSGAVKDAAGYQYQCVQPHEAVMALRQKLNFAAFLSLENDLEVPQTSNYLSRTYLVQYVHMITKPKVSAATVDLGMNAIWRQRDGDGEMRYFSQPTLLPTEPLLKNRDVEVIEDCSDTPSFKRFGCTKEPDLPKKWCQAMKDVMRIDGCIE